MFTDEKITLIMEKLKEKNEDGSLINFWDDTVDWAEIATIALETVMEIVEGEK